MGCRMLTRLKMLCIVIPAILTGRDVMVVARTRRAVVGQAILTPSRRVEMLAAACKMLDVEVLC